MPRKNDATRLTPKQKKFCAEYLKNGGNGSAAARKAGYAKGSAGQAADKLLRQAHIQLELSRLRQSTDAAVLKMLNSGNNKPLPATLQRLVADIGEVVLDRVYVNACLIESMEIALGHRKARVTKYRRFRDPVTKAIVSEQYEEEEFMVSLPSANQAAMLLHRELDRMDGAGERAPVDEDDISAQRQVLAKFGEIGKAYLTIESVPNQAKEPVKATNGKATNGKSH